MDDIETLVVGVRADTGAFAREVAAMRAELEGPLVKSADQAGRAIENALVRALRTGKLGFEDLKRVALSVLGEIASAAYRGGIESIAGSGGLGSLGRILTAALGASGRATGGAVSPGRAYVVGERGPELFVPTAGGRVEPPGRAGRDIRMTVNINAPAGAEPQALAQSSRQVARAVRRALVQAGE